MMICVGRVIPAVDALCEKSVCRLLGTARALAALAELWSTEAMARTKAVLRVWRVAAEAIRVRAEVSEQALAWPFSAPEGLQV